MKGSTERAARLPLSQVRALLARHEASGLTLTAFARREGISFQRLAHYRRRCRLAEDGSHPVAKQAKLKQVRRPRAATAAAPTSSPTGFVRVEPPVVGAMLGATTDTAAVFIHCPGGARLEVHPGFDRALVLDLVRLLQAPPQARVSSQAQV